MTFVRLRWIPTGGAWLYSHLWMEASDGVLHQESDWMREPVINGEPVSEQGSGGGAEDSPSGS